MLKKILLWGTPIGIVLYVLLFTQATINMYVWYVNHLQETTIFRVENEKLYMDGVINSKTPKQLNEVLSKNPQLKTIIQGDMPGCADDDVLFPMARTVREKKLNTYLTSKSEICSGAVDFFTAGVERSMEKGAKIGVHSWHNGSKEATAYPREATEHEANRKFLEDMLGKDDFYWYTLTAAPADGMHYMSDEEIQTYGLLTTKLGNK